MTAAYATPVWFARAVADRMFRAGFREAQVTGVRYVRDGGQDCLETGVFRYPSLTMSAAELQAYEAALRQLPGVVSTRVVHGDESLRDQVRVTHLRLWEEPDD